MIALSFDFQGKPVRTDGNAIAPLFVAADVCAILGLANVTEALRAIPETEKSTLRISEGGPEVNVLREAGLYRLIFRSNKPEAELFRVWVFNEVLPAIRMTGGYQVAAKLDFSDPLTAAQLYIEAETARRQAQQQIADQAPAVAFAEKVQATPSEIGVGNFAQVIGWGQNRLFKELRRRGILFYRDDYNVPKQELIQRGYFKLRETITAEYTHCRVMLTGKGQLWLARILDVQITPMLLPDPAKAA